MERVWAPWRMEYIKAAHESVDGCLFCKIPEEHKDPDNNLLHRGKSAFVMLNKYPYTNGHLMVIPYRHIASYSDLTVEEHIELGQLIARCCENLTTTAHPHGFNVGMNLGLVAGAGIADHLHYHIVPRWSGDTNFMPVLTDTRVVSESLQAVYDALFPLFQEQK